MRIFTACDHQRPKRGYGGGNPTDSEERTHTSRTMPIPFQINLSPLVHAPCSSSSVSSVSTLLFQGISDHVSDISVGVFTESFSLLNFATLCNYNLRNENYIYTLNFNMKTLIYFFPSTYHARSPFYSTDNAMWNNIDADIHAAIVPKPEGDLKWDLSHSPRGGNIPPLRGNPAKELG